MRKILFTMLLVAISFAGIPKVLAVAPYDGGTGDGWAMSSDLTMLVGYGLSSGSNQFFNVGFPSAAVNTISMVFGDVNIPTTSTGIGLILPVGLPCKWDATHSGLTIGGSASAKVSSTAGFSNGNKTAVLTVTSTINDGDSLTVGGLYITGCTAVTGSAQYLGGDINNDGSPELTDGFSWNVLRGGGQADVYHGGSNDGWFTIDSPPYLVGINTQFRGGVNLRGHVNLQ